MVYCYEWLQTLDGTIEKIELKPDLSGTIGEGKLLFRASESPWSREKDADGKDKPNKVTDGPYLFRTGTGRLGMIWTSWIYNVYTQEWLILKAEPWMDHGYRRKTRLLLPISVMGCCFRPWTVNG